MADVIILTTFRFKRGAAADWTTANPTLGPGEPGLETDTGKIKFGDGATAWATLPYATANLAASLQAIVDEAPSPLPFGISLLELADAEAGRLALGLGAVDATLTDHAAALENFETRISALEATVANHEARIAALEAP